MRECIICDYLAGPHMAAAIWLLLVKFRDDAF